MERTPGSGAPTFALARYVDEVRVLAPGGGQASHERLPDGRTMLVFRVLEEGRRGDLSVSGPRTHAHFKTASGVMRAVVVQLKPGWAAALLGVAASALTDRIVTLEELWGRAGKDLRDALLETRTAPQVLDRLARAIATRGDDTYDAASARLARRAVRLLDGDEVRVDRVAARLGVTARHLRRAFTENIGIGPKDYARTVRLRRAVGMTATSKDWGRIAADAGYYDQAHLIGDFRALVGLTPSAFLKRPTAASAASV